MQMNVSNTGEVRISPTDSTNGNFLVGVLVYDCARRYHWGKLGEGYTDSLCIIFYNVCDSIINIK